MPRAVDGELQSAINTLQARVSADPEIQAVLRSNRARLQQTRDRGGDARDYQQTVRDQVTAIARRKGYLPSGGQYFINPNDGQLEPHGGWAGLSNTTRAAIIAAAATAGTLGAGAMGAGPASGMFSGGGATAAGGALPSYGPSAAMHAANMGGAGLPSAFASGTGLGAAGVLPSYGPSAAMQAANMGGAGLPSASMVTPAAAAAAGGGGLLNGLGGANDAPGGGSLLGRVLKGLRDYGPLALGGLSAYRGLTQGPTPAEGQLNEIIDIAKNRVNASEPLFNELNASAMHDAGRMRGRLAQADPMFEMLSNMARSQMPTFTKEG